MAANRGKTRRGFTIVEISVVVLALVLIATLVAPNFVAIKRTRDLYAMESSIVRLPIEARNEARKSQLPVTLRVLDGALVMEHVQPTSVAGPIGSALPGTVTQLGGTARTGSLSASGGTADEVKRVTLSDDIKTETARRNGNPVDAASWLWTVYPDGSADTGGVTFSEGTVRKSLILSADGNVQWITGELPDTTQDSWPAGELLHRG